MVVTTATTRIPTGIRATRKCVTTRYEDCNPATLGPDSDGDGFVNIACCNRTDVGLECGTDCDDELSGVNPGTPESCNGGDEDCDGNIDEDVSSLCAADADNDGFAPTGAMEMAFCESCTELDNWASPPRLPTEIDCNDADPTVNPGATELCDGIDSDCSDDGAIPAPDEDADEDGFASMTSACSGGPLPKLDCNDRDDRVRPDQNTRFHVPHCISGADEGCWRPNGGRRPRRRRVVLRIPSRSGRRVRHVRRRDSRFERAELGLQLQLHERTRSDVLRTLWATPDRRRTLRLSGAGARTCDGSGSERLRCIGCCGSLQLGRGRRRKLWRARRWTLHRQQLIPTRVSSALSIVRLVYSVARISASRAPSVTLTTPASPTTSSTPARTSRTRVPDA